MDKYAQLNEHFRARLSEGSTGIEKAAEAGAAYIKQKLREESFARKILPPVSVSQGEVQRNETDDGIYKLIDIEPDSSAMAMNFRAEGPANYVTGRRFKVGFFKVQSQKFEKQEAELLAYEMPITKILEENAVLDIQREEDSVFYNHAVAAVTGTARDSSSTEEVLTRSGLASARKLVHANKLQPKVILLTEELFNDVLGWNYQVVGDSHSGDLTYHGYKQPTILDMTLVVTNKADIVSAREYWLFTSPECLGRFFLLEDTKFYIDKVADMISWQSWEYVGMGFGNVNGIARVTLS